MGVESMTGFAPPEKLEFRTGAADIVLPPLGREGGAERTGPEEKLDFFAGGADIIFSQDFTGKSKFIKGIGRIIGEITDCHPQCLEIGGA